MKTGQFLTDRIAEWRTHELKESFAQTLERLESFGCEVWTIAADYVTPSFSYTVGVYDTGGQSEFITIGLPAKVAYAALNEAARQTRSGVTLLKGRHPDFLGNVDVEFRPVDPRWMHQIMLRTDWYYKGEDVPVLQLVYPDLENRFPEEPGFDVAFEQPLLSSARDDHESVRSDLWLAYDPSSSLNRWKFPTSPHTSIYLSQTVYDNEEPITYVSHDENGDWQFLGDKMSDGGGPVLVCLHHFVDQDRTLEELHDLPANWYATREEPGAPWQRFENPLDETDEDEGPSEPALLN